ncbi:MAG: Mur ligase family protein [Thermoplasmata archaeon]
MTDPEAYGSAVKWLYDLQYFGMKLGLDNTRALLDELGNPHERLRAVHVAGTNGKGSVCAFLTGILMDAGLKVGTYTSPHLRDFGERICIDSYPMTRAEVLRAIESIRPCIEKLAVKGKQCTFFEATTCMAFQHFARRGIDAAVIEVGMGGRLDSTNVLAPVLSAITNISLEHTQHLGNTLGKIAFEKAGIIKPGVPVVSAVTEPEARKVIEAAARERGSELHESGAECEVRILDAGTLKTTISAITKNNKYEQIHIKLAGAHQATNAATAIVAAEMLSHGIFPVKPENIVRGMERTRWAARLQVVRRRPTVILDATHNPGGAETLAAFLKTHFHDEKPVMVFAMLEDKEVGPVVKLLEPLAARSLVTESSYERRMKAADLASRFSGGKEVIGSVGEAVDRAFAVAGEEGTILITGSIFTAADALEHLDMLRMREIVTILSELHGPGAYPGRDPETGGPPPPGSQEPFRVLISTILSQRTKDENTHVATEALFSVFDTPEKLASADPEEVMALIRPAGFYRQKAMNIIRTATMLRDSFNSKVPDRLESLTSLPGVGRKTANCVLAYGFGIPAIAVDTHVHRISNLMGLVRTQEPDETEECLSRIVPKDLWLDVNRLMVRHGQTICSPVKPRCRECRVSHLCDHGIYC